MDFFKIIFSTIVIMVFIKFQLTKSACLGPYNKDSSCSSCRNDCNECCTLNKFYMCDSSCSALWISWSGLTTSTSTESYINTSITTTTIPKECKIFLVFNFSLI